MDCRNMGKRKRNKWDISCVLERQVWAKQSNKEQNWAKRQNKIITGQATGQQPVFQKRHLSPTTENGKQGHNTPQPCDYLSIITQNLCISQAVASMFCEQRGVIKIFEEHKLNVRRKKCDIFASWCCMGGDVI